MEILWRLGIYCLQLRAVSGIKMKKLKEQRFLALLLTFCNIYFFEKCAQQCIYWNILYKPSDSMGGNHPTMRIGREMNADIQQVKVCHSHLLKIIWKFGLSSWQVFFIRPFRSRNWNTFFCGVNGVPDESGSLIVITSSLLLILSVDERWVCKVFCTRWQSSSFQFSFLFHF